MNTREEDFVEHLFVTSTHDFIMFFTNTGRAFRLKAYELPEASRTAKGTAIVNLLQLAQGENDSSLSNVKYEFKSGVNVINDLFTTILGFRKDENVQVGSNEQDKDDRSKKSKPIKGTDIITHLDVSLEEGYFGTEKKIAIKSFKSGMQTFAVNVPIGIQSGDKIRLAALGNPGKNGGKNGDLIIHVKLLEHEDYKLNGIDLTRNVTVSPAVAAIGGKLKLNIIDEKIIVTLPKHLRNGELVNVPGKGYISEDGKRGDLILKVHIDLPSDISEREEKLYEQILKLEKKREEK